MRPLRALLILLAPLLAAGCAAIGPDRSPEQNARFRLDRGLTALDAGRYAAAFDDLAWVYSRCPAREAGAHALAALAALELDPRHPDGRPEVAADLLGRMIQEPGTPRWVRPLAETTFLAARELGAPHPEPREAAGEPGDATRGPVGVAAEPELPVASPATEAARGCGVAIEPE
ncbi:MAG: hypothetical protein ACLFRX_06035, partial [Gemmatimonadota bacterium]